MLLLDQPVGGKQAELREKGSLTLYDYAPINVFPRGGGGGGALGIPSGLDQQKIIDRTL